MILYDAESWKKLCDSYTDRFSSSIMDCDKNEFRRYHGDDADVNVFLSMVVGAASAGSESRYPMVCVVVRANFEESYFSSISIEFWSEPMQFCGGGAKLGILVVKNRRQG